MSPRSRWAGYGVALLAALLAVRWAGGQDDAVAKPQREVREERPAASAAAPVPREAMPALDVALLGARRVGPGERDLFPAVSWEQKAREEEARRNPPPRPVPPPPPQVPAAPFTYLGKLVEGGATTVFLVQGDRNLIARQGETLAGAWRIDRIDEQAMTFTYLPLDRPQVLSFAASVPGAPAAASGPASGAAQEQRSKDD